MSKLTNKFPRGSEWRKWDLHVHTPDTKKNNKGYEVENEDKWEKFYKTIEDSDVEVIGITDYFSVDNYFKVVDEFYKKYPDSSKVFFPNIELNLDRSSNGQNDGYNVHIILDRLLDKSVIEKFISSLELDNKNPNGTSIKAGEIASSSHVTFESAYTTKELLLKSLNAIFGTETPYLVCTVLHGHRGMQPKPTDGNKPAIANNTDTELTKVFFGCDNKDKDFGLNKNKERGDLPSKPVLTGCDAHSFDDLTNKLGKTFQNNPEEQDSSKQRFTSPTWIKADKTFEGLRQTLFEPGSRVQIQDNSPADELVKITIDKIDIKNQSDFLVGNQTIELNKDLVSVIGGRGSGKSLLLCLLAQINGGEYNNNDGTNEKAELEYTVTNKSKVEEVFKKDIYDYTSAGLPILYLEQKELAKNAEDREEVRMSLLHEIGIEDINTNFNDISAKSRAIIQRLFDSTRKLEAIENSYFLNKEKDDQTKDFKTQIRNDIIKGKEKKDKLSTKETKALIDEISKIITTGTKYKNWIESGQFDQLKIDVIELNKNIEAVNSAITQLEIKGLEEYSKHNIDKLNEIYESNKKKVETERNNLRTALIQKKTELEKLGIKEDITALTESLKTIQEEITRLENSLKEYESLEGNIRVLKEELVGLFAIESELSITARIEEVKTAITQSFDKFIEDNTSDYSDYFNVVFSNITVEPKVYFDHKELIETLVSCFYSGHTPNFKDEIFKGNYPTLEKYIEWITDGSAMALFDFNYGQHFKVNINGAELFIRTVFEDWYKFIKVRPNILGKFGTKEKSIDNMSIGEQATLLLKLKLATEGQVSQIIIIDQPEDHLDNEFISTELIELIKVVKKYKQIIIATHNANVVIGSDSEQVIVARLDAGKGDDNSYLTGSIEDNTIRNSIIKILEGGKIALEKRYTRYK